MVAAVPSGFAAENEVEEDSFDVVAVSCGVEAVSCSGATASCDEAAASSGGLAAGCVGTAVSCETLPTSPAPDGGQAVGLALSSPSPSAKRDEDDKDGGVAPLLVQAAPALLFQYSVEISGRLSQLSGLEYNNV